MSEATIALVALAVAAVANLVMQILAKLEIARVAKRAEMDALSAQRAASHAAEEVREVKQVLRRTTEDASDKLHGLAVVTDSIHKLSNSNMEVQLRLVASLSRRIAMNEPGPATEAAADLAEKELRDHVAKQATVDALQRSP